MIDWKLLITSPISQHWWVIRAYSDASIYFNSIYYTTIDRHLINDYVHLSFAHSLLGGSPCHHSMTRPWVADGGTASNNGR
jgi:hypothetical protein